MKLAGGIGIITLQALICTCAQDVNPRIVQVRPVRGEVWDAGTVETIEWRLKDEVPLGGNLSVYVMSVYAYAGSTNILSVVTNLPVSARRGTAQWLVPDNEPSGDYCFEFVYFAPDLAQSIDYRSTYYYVTITEKKHTQKVRANPGGMILEMAGGAKGALYEIFESTDLATWNPTRNFVTNGIPYVIDTLKNPERKTGFVTLSGIRPITATITHSGEAKVGKPVTFTLHIGGGDQPWSLAFRWWYDKDLRFPAERISGAETMTTTFPIAGVWKGFVEIFTGDVMYHFEDTITIAE
jgi:hypothetical protein